MPTLTTRTSNASAGRGRRMGALVVALMLVLAACSASDDSAGAAQAPTAEELLGSLPAQLWPAGLTLPFDVTGVVVATPVTSFSPDGNRYTVDAVFTPDDDAASAVNAVTDAVEAAGFPAVVEPTPQQEGNATVTRVAFEFPSAVMALAIWEHADGELLGVFSTRGGLVPSAELPHPGGLIDDALGSLPLPHFEAVQSWIYRLVLDETNSRAVVTVQHDFSAPGFEDNLSFVQNAVDDGRLEMLQEIDGGVDVVRIVDSGWLALVDASEQSVSMVAAAGPTTGASCPETNVILDTCGLASEMVSDLAAAFSAE